MKKLFEEKAVPKANIINAFFGFTLVTLLYALVFIWLVYLDGTNENFEGILSGVSGIKVAFIYLIGLILFFYFTSKPLKEAKRNTFLSMTDTYIDGVSYQVNVSKFTGILSVSEQENFHINISQVSTISIKNIYKENIIIINMENGRTFNVLGIKNCNSFLEKYYEVKEKADNNPL